MKSLQEFLTEGCQKNLNDPQSSSYFIIGLLNVMRFMQVLLENPQNDEARYKVEQALSKLNFENFPPIAEEFNPDAYKQPHFSVCMKNGEIFLV